MFLRQLLLLSTLLTLAACDRVAVNNSAGEVGLFVDGQGTPSAINDLRLSKDDTGIASFRVGSYSAASRPDRNEVIGFGEGRAPARITTVWTSGDDSFNFDLEQPIEIDLTFWVIQGPLDVAEFRINTGLVASDELWEEERAGFVIGDVEIVDARNDPDIDDAILNSVGGNNRNWEDFTDEIGFRPGRVNVYWINTVEGSDTMGWSDFGALIVMGFGANSELLTHEIGHSMNLAHPEDGNIDNQFNAFNVMTANTNSRRYMTEGQTFRAHFEPGSVVNATLMARPGQPTQPCDLYDESEACPGLQRRIWADGSAFPPN